MRKIITITYEIEIESSNSDVKDIQKIIDFVPFSNHFIDGYEYHSKNKVLNTDRSLKIKQL